jgi:hypothetical protein
MQKKDALASFFVGADFAMHCEFDHKKRRHRAAVFVFSSDVTCRCAPG